MIDSLLKQINSNPLEPFICKSVIDPKIFNWADVDRYINSNDRNPIELIGENKIKKVLSIEEIQLGRTFILLSMSRYNKVFNDLCNTIETYLNVVSDINVYGSKSLSNSFPIHKDVTNVLIVQLDGDCEWKVWSTEKVTRNQEPFLCNVLRPGDALYIPEGVYHCCEPLGKRISISISFAKPSNTAIAQDRS